VKALVLREDRSLRLVDRQRPVCAAPDDVIVRIAQAGICGTDRGVLLGKFHAEPGVVMGHEAVGEVAETGAGVTTLKQGDRVIINPTLYCGLCHWCRRGALNFCLNKAGNEIGIDRDGAFAGFMRLEERFLHAVPEGMSDDQAVLAEPVACVLNNLEAAGIRPDDEVAVLGGGPIGTLVALVADHFGAAVRVVETDPYRRATAEAFLAAAPGCTARVEEPGAIAPRSASLVVDSVGSLTAEAWELAANLGRIVVMGFNDRATWTMRPLELLQRGLRVIGACDYNSLLFDRAVELARRLPLSGLISHHVPVDRFTEALAAIGAAGNGHDPYTGMKVVIDLRDAA
jgi:threonine dehydrogenase-like Zn-dependent dehydrogenase